MLIPFEVLEKRCPWGTLRGVLHLGAHYGQEIVEYEALGVGQVVWIEALPAVCEELRRRVASYRLHSTVLCACVASCSGKEVTFYEASNEGQSSSLLLLGTHAQEHPTVRYVREHRMRTITVEDLLQQQGLIVGPDWMLNVDLQGTELDAMRGMVSLFSCFSCVYCEVNRAPLYVGCAQVGQVDTFLAERGFVPVETRWTEHGWGDRFYLRG